MLSNSFINKYLKEELSEERYHHSLAVSIEAARLAKHYNYDANRAKLAGILHDCAKDVEINKQKHYAKNCGFFIDDLTYKMPQLIHAPASVYISREILKISDIEILSAIRYHTTGKADMSIIEKIIFLADIIEPGRKFKCLAKLREMAYKNLDKAVLYALDFSIAYIIKNKSILHFDTVDARNYLLNPDIFN